MRRLLLALALLPLAWAPVALGISSPSEMLPDPVQEQRAREIGRQLRCLVCQNESIEDSNADLARDLRQLVRERVAAGDDNAAVINYIHARYGDFVLLRPPFNLVTAALWGMPVLALGGGLLAILLLRRRGAAPEPAPLSPEEQARLAALEKDAAR